MMLEEDLELKFVCKLCNKKCPCGKSLGGHMKSHVAAISSESEGKAVGVEQKLLTERGQFFGYGLRENPKKTRKAFDSILTLSRDNVCQQCGEGFMSLKALCDHMASRCEMLITEECEHRTESSKSETLKKVGVNSPLNSSSPVSEVDVLEREEVAMCLMILSMDSWNRGVVTNSAIESSDKDSPVTEAKSSSIDTTIAENEGLFNIHKQSDVEEMKLKGAISNDEIAETEDSESDSGYFLGEYRKAESDVSVDGFRTNDTLSKFKKALFSTQERYSKEFDAGLGISKNVRGKRSIRTKFSSKLTKENGHVENGMTSDVVRNESRKRELDSQKNSSAADTCNKPRKRSKYECFNCKKAFKSYQALGGHRPCLKRANNYCESTLESVKDDSNDHIIHATKQQVESGFKRRQPSASWSQKKVKSKKSNRPHVCPFCSRVFKNGHALGGHKRSHFLSGIGNANQSPVIKLERLLDLNLPPPEVDRD